MLVNSNNTNYKVANPRLRPSCSTHSEHSIKYFAIDYFLKLLKIIVAEGRDGTITQNQSMAISQRTTASSFNSHHYCQIQSCSKTSSHDCKILPCLDVSPGDNQTCTTFRGVPNNTNDVQTESETVSIRTHAQSIKAKLKRFKKRKTRRSFIEKHLNRTLNPTTVRVKQETDLANFELNRFVLNKSIKEEMLNKTIKGETIKSHGLSPEAKPNIEVIQMPTGSIHIKMQFIGSLSIDT